MFTQVKSRNLFVFGGLISSAILILFGAASLVVGWQGREDVRDTLRQEQIVGPDDSAIPGQLVDTGSEARAQADIIRHHQLEATGGLTYSEMGRFATPDGDPKGTNDASLAATNAEGKPLPNTLRDRWVTATALSTSLNTAFFAEQVALFSIVMGTALLLTGAGFGVLTLGALRIRQAEEKQQAATAAGATKPLTA